MKYNIPKPTLIGTLPAFGTYYHQVYGYTENEVLALVESVVKQIKKECADVCVQEARTV